MRIAAMFREAGRRALKWTVLFGAASALGAGSALAQLEYDGTAKPLEVREGGRVTVPFRVRVARPAEETSAKSFRFEFQLRPATTGTSLVGGSGLPSPAEPGDIEYPFLPGTDAVEVRIPRNTSADPDTLTVRGTVDILASTDFDADDELGNLEFNITANADNVKQADNPTANIGSVVLVQLLVRDHGSHEFEWVDPTPEPVEGTNATVGVRAKHRNTNVEWHLTFFVDGSGYSLRQPHVLREVYTTPTQTLTIEPPASQDGNRVDDEVRLLAHVLGTNQQAPGLDPLTFTFEDLHALPGPDKITWKAYTDDNGKPSTTEAASIVEGGPPVHVTVTVDRGEDGYPRAEGLKVTPTVADPAQALDFRLGSSSFNIAGTGSGKKSGTFMVYASADDDIGAEELVLNLRVEGMKPENGDGEVVAALPFRIPIEDETAPLVSPKSAEAVAAAVDAAMAAGAGGDDLWTPGETLTLQQSQLFESTNPVEVSAVSSDASVGASVAGGTVTLTAMSVGTAVVKVTGTVIGASAVTTAQTRSNVASVEFDVAVDELPLEITLSGPEDLNVAEGASALVTATANRAVTADTTVELLQTGGDASPDDYDVEPIVIAAGGTTGTTMLTAMADADETERPETLTVEGRFGDGMKTNAVTFNLWDAAVPALPVVAQLLLAALLAAAGCRRFLRR